MDHLALAVSSKKLLYASMGKKKFNIVCISACSLRNKVLLPDRCKSDIHLVSRAKL